MCTVCQLLDVHCLPVALSRRRRAARTAMRPLFLVALGQAHLGAAQKVRLHTLRAFRKGSQSAHLEEVRVHHHEDVQKVRLHNFEGCTP